MAGEDLGFTQDPGQVSQAVNSPAPQTHDDLGFVPDKPAPADDLGFVPDQPDTSAMKEHTSANIKAQQDAEKEKAKTSTAVKGPGEFKPPQHPAEGIIEALESGWQTSFSGLMSRGKLPDTVLPEDAPRAMKIASMVSGLAGDLPAMAAGMVGGADVAGPPGALAGAFAVPQAMRKVLMDHYEKGDVMSAGDFSDRVVSTAWEGAKGALTGLATYATGGLVGPVAGPIAAKIAEVAAMTTVSKGLEGHLPEPDDFINGALVMGGLHALGPATEAISGKLRDVYAERGAQPKDLVPDAVADPVVKPKILSQNIPGDQIELPTDADQGIKGAKPLTEEQMLKDPQKYIDQVNPEPPAKPPSSELSDSENKVLDRIGEQAEPAQKSFDYNQFRSERIDFLHQIKVDEAASGVKVTPDNSAYVVGRTMAAYTDKVREFFEHGTRDFETGKVNGEPLTPIIDAAAEAGGGNTDKFNAYIVSKRAIELEGRGIKTGIPLDAAKQVVADGKDTFDPIQRRLVDYRGRVLDYMTDSGIFNEGQRKAMDTLNKEHVPFYRIQEPDPVTGKIAGQGKGVKRITGSDLQIKDPIVSTFKDTDMMIKMAEENKMKSKFVDQIASSDKADQFLRKVEPPQRPIDVGADELNRALREQGIDDANLQEGTKIFRPATTSYDPKTQIIRYVDGVKETYEGSPGLIEALNSFNGNEAGANTFTALMKPFAKATRIGFTSDPGFALRHFFRAQMFSGLTSKTGLIPFVHPALALGDFFANEGRGSELYHQWLFDGGAQRSFEPIDDGYVKNKIMDLDKDTPFIKQGWNAITTPFKAAHAFIMLSDNLTRFAEYKRSPGIADETAGPAERAQAAMNSREVTPDYSVVGSKMAAIQATVPFYNAGLQGIDLAARTFANDPVGSTAKALAYYTVPALLAWYATHDDERYKQLPSWQKNLYTNIPVDHWRDSNAAEASSFPETMRKQNGDKWQVNDGTTFKIPQTFDVGLLFGSLPMRILDAYKDHDPTAMHDFLKSMGEKLPGIPMAAAAMPPLEQMTNYNFFTGSPVVPDSKTKLLPELQYTPYTSETAKALGKLIHYVPGVRSIGPGNNTLESPMIIDNYIKSWGGPLGQYAVAIADKAIVASGINPDPNHAKKDLSEMPFFKEFATRFPDAHMKDVQDFEDMNKHAETLAASFQELVRQQKPDQAMALKQRYSDAAPTLEGVQKGIQAQRSIIQKLDSMTMDPVQKRQLQDGALFQMLRAAKAGNKMLDDLAKTKGNN